MNASKNKGTAFESAVRDYLRWALSNTKIDRAVLHGTDDIGDISGVYRDGVPVVIECKSRKKPQAYEALHEAIQESENLEKIVGGTCLPAAIVHLPGIGIKSPQRVGQQLVVLPHGEWMGTYMSGVPHENTGRSGTYIRTPVARLHSYSEVARAIESENDGEVSARAAELPGSQKLGDRLVDITSLRDFAVALNGFRMIGETRAVACRDTPACSNDRCIVQCEEERRTQ